MKQAPFHRELDVANQYRYYLIFLAVFTPVFLSLQLTLFSVIPEYNLKSLIGGLTLSLFILLAIGILFYCIYRKGGKQVWRIENGRASYSSPSSYLGKSFSVEVASIDQMKAIDEGGTILCTLKDGTKISFMADSIEGRLFYKELKQQTKFSD